jgi:hypothetical protein
VALKLEKQRVISTWSEVASLCLTVNAYHCTDAIVGALRSVLTEEWGEAGSGPLVPGWPQRFPEHVVLQFNELLQWSNDFSPSLERFVAAAIKVSSWCGCWL